MSKIKVDGFFKITPHLSDYDRFYLYNFNATVHIKRNPIKLSDIYNGKYSYNGRYGQEGEFFIRHIIDPNGNLMSDIESDYSMDNCTIVDGMNPPSSQPGLYCPWKPSYLGDKLVPDNKDFYQSNFKWLRWLVDNFFINNYYLNGKIIIETDSSKREVILKNNKITYKLFPKKKINEIKSHSDILTSLINQTNDHKIIWKEIPDFDKYTTDIPIKDDVRLIINLFIRDFNSNKNYINIYLKKSHSMNHFANIRGRKVNDLVDSILKIEYKHVKEKEK